MSDQKPAASRKGIPVWALVLILLVLALVAGGTAYYLSSRAADSDAEDTAAEADIGDAEPGDTGSEPQSDEDQSDVTESDDAAGETRPSYVRFAYVLAITGAPGAWEASLDLFDIYTGAEADAYATSHGLPVPANGILYVNESETPVSLPLSDAAVITYNTGGVESLETHAATIQQLRDYAAGSATAMPDAFRDQWKVTVENGVVTRVEMIAVAD